MRKEKYFGIVSEKKERKSLPFLFRLIFYIVGYKYILLVEIEKENGKKEIIEKIFSYLEEEAFQKFHIGAKVLVTISEFFSARLPSTEPTTTIEIELA